MKKFKVTIKYSHESFGVYYHNDGSKIFEVLARNADSAGKKALKIARKTCGGYETRIVFIDF